MNIKKILLIIKTLFQFSLLFLLGRCLYLYFNVDVIADKVHYGMIIIMLILLIFYNNNNNSGTNKNLSFN